MRDEQKDRPDKPRPSHHDRTIHVISGGSKISAILVSAAKQHEREDKETPSFRRSLGESDSYTIFFCNKEADELPNPYHDTVVISLYITNCLIKRSLVDKGSSANILQLNTLKEMQMDETQIIRCSVMLIGFNGE